MVFSGQILSVEMRRVRYPPPSKLTREEAMTGTSKIVINRLGITIANGINISSINILMKCPDDQFKRCRAMYYATLDGDWKKAIHHLKKASEKGTTKWHQHCLEVAIFYETHFLY
jgi:hypothetical protein